MVLKLNGWVQILVPPFTMCLALANWNPSKLDYLTGKMGMIMISTESGDCED